MTANILTDRLPEYVEINGALYPISSDFRTGVAFEIMIMDNDALPPEELALTAFELYFPAGIPDEPPADIMQAILYFYSRGKTTQEKKKKEKEEDEDEAEEEEEQPGGRRAYSYLHDADYIYAAFLAQYGIDLTTAELHWWQFLALFKGLSPDCIFVKIMGYRTAKFTTNMSQAERDNLRRLKKTYALPLSQSEQAEHDALVEALQNGGDLTALLGGGTDES